MTGELRISAQGKTLSLSLMLCIAVLGVPMRAPAQNIITTVAGDGRPFFSGDDGPATSASLNYPNRIALDSAGNLFIADTSNNRIRRMDGGGIITTVAGNGVQGFGGDGGPATGARLNRPTGVT